MPKVKIKDNDILEINKMYMSNIKTKDIAKTFNVHVKIIRFYILDYSKKFLKDWKIKNKKEIEKDYRKNRQTVKEKIETDMIRNILIEFGKSVAEYKKFDEENYPFLP